jgi:hypothetical protein
VSPELYLAVTLLPVIATVVLLFNWGSWTPRREILVRILILIATSFMLLLFPVYTDHPPSSPVSVLGLFCVPLVVFFIKELRAAVVAGLVVAAFAFSNDSMYETAFRDPTLSRYFTRLNERENARSLTFIALTVSDDAKPNSGPQPACFVDALQIRGIQEDIRETEKDFPVREYRLVPFWHSELTNLYRLESRPARVWFRGGRLDQDRHAYQIVGVGQFKPGLWPPSHSDLRAPLLAGPRAA